MEFLKLVSENVDDVVEEEEGAHSSVRWKGDLVSHPSVFFRRSKREGERVGRCWLSLRIITCNSFLSVSN